MNHGLVQSQHNLVLAAACLLISRANVNVASSGQELGDKDHHATLLTFGDPGYGDPTLHYAAW